jgi:hypothetical protein
MPSHPLKVWLRSYKVFLPGASALYIANNGSGNSPVRQRSPVNPGPAGKAGQAYRAAFDGEIT